MSDLSKQGLVGNGYLCSTDTVSTSLTFMRRAISWSALSESTPHIFQWFPSHRQFPPATDSTCQRSCILIIIVVLVAQSMASNMKEKSIGRCTRLALIHLYHLYIECLFCGEAAVKTHGPHSRPLTAQNSVVQTDIILNHPLTSIRLCHEEETLLGFPSHFTQFDSIFLLIQPVWTQIGTCLIQLETHLPGQTICKYIYSKPAGQPASEPIKTDGAGDGEGVCGWWRTNEGYRWTTTMSPLPPDQPHAQRRSLTRMIILIHSLLQKHHFTSE